MLYKPIPTSIGVGFLSNDRLFITDAYTEVERFNKFYYLVKDFNFDIPGYVGYSNLLEENIIVCSYGSSYLDDIRALCISSMLAKFLPKGKINVKITDDYGVLDFFDKRIIINPENSDSRVINVGKVLSNYKYSESNFHYVIFDMLCYKFSTNIIYGNIKRNSEYYFRMIKDIKNMFNDISGRTEFN